MIEYLGIKILKTCYKSIFIWVSRRAVFLNKTLERSIWLGFQKNDAEIPGG